ncbi:MAG: SIS domain-containing protein [Ruminococcaceae bacterium]|nr:SIS domain-containing protein [Oscillospiraceae bacterium]
MFNELLERYPCLKDCGEQIKAADKTIIDTYENGGKLMVCGNGGSCADSEHIVGELMKGFLSLRPLDDSYKAELKAANPELDDDMLSKLQGALPALALTGHNGLTTAYSNDVDPSLIFAQQLFGIGNCGDVFIGITTSGNSKNVVKAAQLAKALGIKVIGLTGKMGGKMKEIADVCICVPETETFKVQELHLPVYHFLCASAEKHFFG